MREKHLRKIYDYELVYNYVLELIQNELDEHSKIPSEIWTFVHIKFILHS